MASTMSRLATALVLCAACGGDPFVSGGAVAVDGGPAPTDLAQRIETLGPEASAADDGQSSEASARDAVVGPDAGPGAREAGTTPDAELDVEQRVDAGAVDAETVPCANPAGCPACSLAGAVRCCTAAATCGCSALGVCR